MIWLFCMGHLVVLCALCILVSVRFPVQLTSFVIMRKLSNMATLDNFISAPSEEPLGQFTKDQLLKLAGYYDFEIASSEFLRRCCLREVC